MEMRDFGPAGVWVLASVKSVGQAGRLEPQAEFLLHPGTCLFLRASNSLEVGRWKATCFYINTSVTLIASKTQPHCNIYTGI